MMTAPPETIYEEVHGLFTQFCRELIAEGCVFPAKGIQTSVPEELVALLVDRVSTGNGMLLLMEMKEQIIKMRNEWTVMETQRATESDHFMRLKEAHESAQVLIGELEAEIEKYKVNAAQANLRGGAQL